jgi:hypothetical protein
VSLNISWEEHVRMKNIIDGAMMDVIKDNFCPWHLSIHGV